ncbi:50S ribosomal protein L28 [Patescibacteria group bacterium]|nr:50S ribosomal protein L28 [Patescibacteria group bacterium]
MRKGKFGCAMCGKGVQFGNKVSHAKNRNKMIRRPNLHMHKMLVDGKMVKVKLCTKCKRAARKAVIGGQPETVAKK